MGISPLWVALISITLSVAAQFALKAGMHAHSRAGAGESWMALMQPMVLAGLALYGLGAIIWLSVLARWDVSKAYPLVGFGFVLSLMVGFMLGEHISMLRVCGVLLICIGVGLVSQS